MATILDDSGPDISKRAVQPMLNDDTTGLVAEAQEILKAGLSGTFLDRRRRHRHPDGGNKGLLPGKLAHLSSFAINCLYSHLTGAI